MLSRYVDQHSHALVEDMSLGNHTGLIDGPPVIQTCNPDVPCEPVVSVANKAVSVLSSMHSGECECIRS